MTKLPAQIYDATDNPEGGIYLRVPWDPDFLEEFQGEIPYEHRSWDREDREWWVSDRYGAKARRIASQYFNLEYCDSEP